MNATSADTIDTDRRAVDDGIAIARSVLGTPLEARAPAVIAKLVERFPQVARVHLMQAHLHRRVGRLDLAAQAARRALTCAPDDVAALRLATALRGEALPADQLIGVPAPIRLYRDFFDPPTHRRILDLALAAEPALTPSSVGGIDPYPDWRRSKVDRSPHAFEALALAPILAAAREAVVAFAMPAFPFASIEMQFTAHNDGDFYKSHRDHGEGGLEHRRLTFVYYFNRQPRAFSGGDLALFDSLSDGSAFDEQAYSLVEPADNMLILFPSSFWHEVRKVDCASGAYADSRFTLNGWIGVEKTAKTNS